MKRPGNRTETGSGFLVYLIGILFITGLACALEAYGSADEGRFMDRAVSAVRGGSLGGEAGIYYEHTRYDRKSFVEDGETVELRESNLVVPYIQMDYLSPRYRVFSIGVGLTGYVRMNDDPEDQGRAGDHDSLLFHHLYLRYDISETTLKLGRQSVEDSMFLTDYYEALSIRSGEIDNIEFSFFVVQEVADSDVSEFIEFENINRGDKAIDDFLYAAELTWNLMEEAFDTTLYFYHQKNLYNLYGTHITLSHDMNDLGIGLDFDFYATGEDSENGMTNINDEVDDTGVYHVRPYLEFSGFSLAAGYIKADRLSGAREGGLIDDYFNPFNEGNTVYEPDAETWYGEAGHEGEDFNIGVIFGVTDYVDNGRRLTEKEFDITAGFTFWERFTLETEFARVYSDSPEGDYTLLETSFSYQF